MPLKQMLKIRTKYLMLVSLRENFEIPTVLSKSREEKDIDLTELSATQTEYYVENPRIADPLLMETVGDVRDSGSSAKRIFAYLRERTDTVVRLHEVRSHEKTLSDVTNLLQAIRNKRCGNVSDSKCPEYVLREFVDQQNGN
ncbi:Hypothetical protein PHPALM_15937 [Phytophthora palmivora]|uniref:Uncharacterized protein n=1 Tax=Phytophthora palmivora TaxID=4796 RepID=A0A2P4XQY7_9STRA|nr:Hypothetical protein PHPALM_15937 [Phytophthora palmivora]